MNAYKRLSILSFSILAACAPPKSAIQSENTGSVNTSRISAPDPRAPLANTAAPNVVQPATAQANISSVKGADKQTSQSQVKGSEATLEKLPANTKARANVPSSWELSGAMAARNKNKAWSASINWVQRGASSYQIRLSGPLGSGTVLIAKQGGMVTFRDGAKSASSSNAAELLQQQTGVRLPVNSLYYWVRGIPAPGAVQAEKRDKLNHLQMLRQDGYTIEYGSYSAFGSTSLPNQIRLQGNGLFIKLVVNRWKV